MNKKVFASMLFLCVIFLVACYILKFFFPEEFVMIIELKPLLKLGNFVDSHQFVRYICSTITSFITYWLFMCACKQSWYLNWKECIVILGFMSFARLVNLIDPNIATHVNITIFFLIPFICKFNLKIATLIYTVHGASQVLSLGIRNLPMYMTQVTYVTVLACTLETYLWLCLFYILFNYSKGKESKLWDLIARHTTA